MFVILHIVLDQFFSILICQHKLPCQGSRLYQLIVLLDRAKGCQGYLFLGYGSAFKLREMTPSRKHHLSRLC